MRERIYLPVWLFFCVFAGLTSAVMLFWNGCVESQKTAALGQAGTAAVELTQDTGGVGAFLPRNRVQPVASWRLLTAMAQ